MGWFERNIAGLSDQIDGSGGYIIYPDVAEWGLVITGGQYGRGVLNDSDDRQLGWASINTGSLGLQAGVQGFKMLVVFEDAATLEAFQKGRLTGGGSGVAIIGDAGGSAKVGFSDGVAIYQGANTGLMAGVSFGLDLMRYEPLSD